MNQPARARWLGIGMNGTPRMVSRRRRKARHVAHHAAAECDERGLRDRIAG